MRWLALLVLPACSMFATEGPASAPGPTRCNRSSAPVLADAVTGLGAAAASAFSSLQHARSGDVIIPAVIGGVFGASSIYGAVQVGRCRSAHAVRPQWSLDDMPAVM